MQIQPIEAQHTLSLDFEVEDGDENLFDQVPLSSPVKESKGRLQSKLKPNKTLLRRLVEDRDQDESQEQPKPKGKRLMSKSSIKKRMSSDSEMENRQIGENMDIMEGNDNMATPLKSRDQKRKEKMSEDQFQAEEDSFISEEEVPKKKGKKDKEKKQKEPKEKLKKMSKKEQNKIKHDERWKQWQQEFKDDDDKEAEGVTYYTGLEFLKKEKKQNVRVNKMIGGLDIDLNTYEDQLKQEEFTVNIKARESVSDRPLESFSFFKKAEKIMAARRADRQPLSEGIEDSASKRAKESLSKLITSSSIHQNVELELKINIPCVAKGKSNHLLNSTIYLKKLVSSETHIKEDPNPQPCMEPIPLETKTFHKPSQSKKVLTRKELFSSITRDIRKRKSQTLTFEEIRDSFKKTELTELDDLKKTIESKRKEKYGLVDSDPNDSDFQPEAEEENQQGQQDQQNQHDQSEGTRPDNTNTKTLKQPSEAPIPECNEEEQNPPDESAKRSRGERGQLSYEEDILDDPINEEQYRRLLRLDGDEEEFENNEESSEEADGEQQDEDQEDDGEGEDENKQQNDQKDERMEIEDQPATRSHQKALQFDPTAAEEKVKARKNKINTILEEQEGEQEGLQEQQMGTQEHLNHPADAEDEQEPGDDSGAAQNGFKKLKKTAIITKEKMKRIEEGKRKAERFFDDEAELGSDNEDNDFLRKEINKLEEQEEQNLLGDNLDDELKSLIDNAVDFNESDEEAAVQKMMEEERLREKEELSRVIHGKFKKNEDDHRFFDENHEEEENREKRMNHLYEEMKRRDQEEDAYYVYNNFNNAAHHSSQSESEEIGAGPFHQELQKLAQRDMLMKKKMVQPLILRKSKIRYEQTPQRIAPSDKTFNIQHPAPRKRGSILGCNPSQLLKRPQSQLSKHYSQQTPFQQKSTPFSFMLNKAKSRGKGGK